MKRKKQFAYTVTSLLTVALVVVLVYTFGRRDQVQNLLQKNTPADNTSVPTIESFKKLKLEAVGGSGIVGDGTLVLKNNSTVVSFGITQAGNVKANQQFTVFVVLPGQQEPILLGTMLTSPPGSKYQFVLGSSGNREWFAASKIQVYKVDSSKKAPGVLVSEAPVSDASYKP